MRECCMTLEKTIEAITEADLQSLVDQGEANRESKTIEYKSAWPSGKDQDKHEFLADVSAFANTAGGDLIYGIESKAGVPVNLGGMALPDTDAACLFAHQVIESGLTPRVPRIEVQPIAL